MHRRRAAVQRRNSRAQKIQIWAGTRALVRGAIDSKGVLVGSSDRMQNTPSRIYFDSFPSCVVCLKKLFDI